MKMNLHRANSAPEWETVPPEERNIFQKIAAKTNGWVRPADAVSIIGLGLVLDGLYDISQNQKLSGVIKIGFGRGMDVADGIVADKTGTKSSAGETVDATIDKIEMAAALVTFWSAEIAPVAPLAVVTAQNLANVGATGIAKFRNKEPHPSKSGKLNTFFQWIGLGSFAVASIVDPGAADTAFEAIGWAGTVGSTITLGAHSSYELANTALSANTEDINIQVD